jgi:hypothetical protein
MKGRDLSRPLHLAPWDHRAHRVMCGRMTHYGAHGPAFPGTRRPSPRNGLEGPMAPADTDLGAPGSPQRERELRPFPLAGDYCSPGERSAPWPLTRSL